MQEDTSNSESTFEFIEKKSADTGDENDEEDGTSLLYGSTSKFNRPRGYLVTAPSKSSNVSKSPLLSNVPPPSALPSFVPVVSQPQMFHQSSFNPVFPASKSDGSSPVTQDDSSIEKIAQSAVSDFSTNTVQLFGWMKDTVSSKGGTLLSKVAEKAKSSVDSVITTLDPQMKEFLSAMGSGDEVEIIVASDKEVKVSPIREAFQSIVGNVNVRGVATQPLGIAKQPVGFEAANKAACSRIENVRKQESFHGPVVAIENFIIEVAPGKWFDAGLVVLNEMEKGINLETYTEFTPLPIDIVSTAKEDTPKDYEDLSTGFSVTIGSLMANNLQVSPNEWHYVYTGVSRREMLLNAGRMIAGSGYVIVNNANIKYLAQLPLVARATRQR